MSGRALLLALALLGCGGSKGAEAPIGISSTQGEPVQFSFDSLDERAVSAEASRGAPAVVTFVATWDMLSQAQADFISVMAKTDGDRIHYYLVVLDGEPNRELVEAFASTLSLSCPVAMGDRETVAGRGPFGEIAVPTVVVLDSGGREVWRKIGLAKSDELRQVLGSLEQAEKLRAPGT